MQSTAIYIPAHKNSRRFYNKVLQAVEGKTLLEFTIKRALSVRDCTVYVVYDGDKDIKEAALRALPEDRIIETPVTCTSGTQRASFAARHALHSGGHQMSIVWQADEPAVKTADVQELLSKMYCYRWECATLVSPWGKSDPEDANNVKAAFSHNRCLWFSRANMKGSSLHVGIYGFETWLLQQVYNWNPSHFHMNENLEQLTWLERGTRVHGVMIDQEPLSINTPADWAKFVALNKVQNEEL